MIIEIAEFKILPDAREQFATAITHAAAHVLAKADGYRGHRILACRESPGRFLLTVEWESLQAHTVGFRQSPAFAEWRALIGPYFAEPPHVEHFDLLADG
jgi:heme-degrading monooxygenase HmoA